MRNRKEESVLKQPMSIEQGFFLLHLTILGKTFTGSMTYAHMTFAHFGGQALSQTPIKTLRQLVTCANDGVVCSVTLSPPFPPWIPTFSI